MLNTLWLGFFLTAAIAALAQWLLGGQAQVFAVMVESLFAMAKLSVEVMVLLFGTLTLWLGFLRIAEKAGIVNALARWLAPLEQAQLQVFHRARSSHRQRRCSASAASRAASAGVWNKAPAVTSRPRSP